MGGLAGEAPPDAEQGRVLRWLLGSPLGGGDEVAPESFLRPHGPHLLLEIGPRYGGAGGLWVLGGAIGAQGGPTGDPVGAWWVPVVLGGAYVCQDGLWMLGGDCGCQMGIPWVLVSPVGASGCPVGCWG